MPYWKEPAEAASDREVREVWVLKCARAGASENILLNPIRWAVAQRPQPVLYVSGQQASVERFMEKRIKLGMRLAKDTQAKYREARVREHEVFFDDMDLIATWPKNKMAFKQSGYSLILADEVSTWPEYSTEMLRKRTANWAFPTIIGISSPDPQQNRGSDKDPIFQEYEQTDKRVWQMPSQGQPFVFEMGWKDEKTKLESAHGLKWDQEAKREDGSWDLDRVRESAHYITPSGERLEESDRWPMIKQGQWVATQEGRAGKRGYYINAFYMPWFSFGDIAVSFLEAMSKNTAALKTWLYEWMAEPWFDRVDRVTENEFNDNVGEYARGQEFTQVEGYKEAYLASEPIAIMTVDVQKAHFWWTVRVWCRGGASGLVDYGMAGTWAELNDISVRLKTYLVLVDSGYGERTNETYQACREYRFIPTKGTANKLSQPYIERSVNPELGRAIGVEQLPLLSFDTNLFKDMLAALIRGETHQPWLLPADTTRDYFAQMTAEEKTDRGWQPKRKRADNHLWDCEVLQVLAAARIGYAVDIV